MTRDVEDDESSVARLLTIACCILSRFAFSNPSPYYIIPRLASPTSRATGARRRPPRRHSAPRSTARATSDPRTSRASASPGTPSSPPRRCGSGRRRKARRSELKGVEGSSVETAEGWAERNASGRDPKVLKDRRSQRERGRMGTSVRWSQGGGDGARSNERINDASARRVRRTLLFARLLMSVRASSMRPRSVCCPSSSSSSSSLSALRFFRRLRGAIACGCGRARRSDPQFGRSARAAVAVAVVGWLGASDSAALPVARDRPAGVVVTSPARRRRPPRACERRRAVRTPRPPQLFSPRRARAAAAAGAERSRPIDRHGVDPDGRARDRGEAAAGRAVRLPLRHGASGVHLLIFFVRVRDERGASRSRRRRRPRVPPTRGVSSSSIASSSRFSLHWFPYDRVRVVNFIP